eukprot:2820425-Alexandrium_andersonii.AAC.1
MLHRRVPRAPCAATRSLSTSDRRTHERCDRKPRARCDRPRDRAPNGEQDAGERGDEDAEKEAERGGDLEVRASPGKQGPSEVRRWTHGVRPSDRLD